MVTVLLVQNRFGYDGEIISVECPERSDLFVRIHVYPFICVQLKFITNGYILNERARDLLGEPN